MKEEGEIRSIMGSLNRPIQIKKVINRDRKNAKPGVKPKQK